MLKTTPWRTVCVLVFCAFLTSCLKKEEDDIEELGQQIGETMASVDEVGGSSGSFPTASLRVGAEKFFARRSSPRLSLGLAPGAWAGACATDPTFSACSAKKITRTFGECTLGALTFDGTIDFNFTNNDNNCLLDEIDETVVRSPNFAVAGKRGALLTVAVSGNAGQTIKRTGLNTFTFENDGIRRTFVTAGGQTLFKHVTKTTSPISMTGATRTDRVMNGGTLQVVDELNGFTCDTTPNNVKWTSASCNCAVSGNWSGTCTDGDAVALVISGCGQATMTKGDITVSLTFDRCY